MRRSEKPLRRLVPILGVAAVGLVAFVVVYNSFIKYREYPMTIEEFFSSGYVERYLASGGADAGANYIGRFDSMQYAAEHIASDPLKLAFGYGAGNVSTSFLDEFEGRYVHYYDRYGVGMTQVSHFLWEIGVVGLAAYVLLYWFLFSDARLLARSSTPFAAFGQLWATVMLIMGFALIYKSIFAMNEIGYVFWYYGGVVASEAVLLRRARHATAQAARQMPAAWRAATGNALLEHRNLGLKGS